MVVVPKGTIVVGGGWPPRTMGAAGNGMATGAPGGGTHCGCTTGYTAGAAKPTTDIACTWCCNDFM